ncbi:MAG: TerB family tellurite resistance protein [Myxococcota bacterium]|nr:TerB family tellurite resistance protein [Myxococcota bacterium]
MSDWMSLSQEIHDKPLFHSLDHRQTEAIIDVLCLMMYADNRVSTLEEIEFREILLRLPWLQDHGPLVEGRINVSASKARYAATAEDRKALIETAANAFRGTDLAINVYALAETMAHSDLVFHDREQDVLAVLAQTLGLPQAALAKPA